MNEATRIELADASVLDQLPGSLALHNPCDKCELQAHCLPELMSNTAKPIRDRVLTGLVQQQIHHVSKNKPLFRQHEPFDTLYIVRSGAVKTVLLDAGGCEQISGFYYPGDVFGLDGISTNRHATTAIAMGNTRVCAVEFARLETASTLIPSLQHHLFQLMAREVARNQSMMTLLSRKSADQKVAYLLLRYGQHLQRLGLDPHNSVLPMSRRDMGNHLGLAVETVSRIFTRFQRLQLCRIHGRRVEYLDLAALQQQLDPPKQSTTVDVTALPT